MPEGAVREGRLKGWNVEERWGGIYHKRYVKGREAKKAKEAKRS